MLVFTIDVSTFKGELNVIGSFIPLLDSAKSKRNTSSTITLFAVKPPTNVAFPTVVSPNSDAVITSVFIKSISSLDPSNQF